MILLLLVLGLFILAPLFKMKRPLLRRKSMSVQQLSKRLGGLPVMVDLRDSASFRAGHIPGSANIPSPELERRVSELAAYREQKVHLICSRGKDCGSASTMLKELGFLPVIVEGGVEAWKRAGFPLQKSIMLRI